MPNDNWYLFDARNDRVLGGFNEQECRAAASDLNKMVLRNTLPIFASMGAKVEGPFYARKQK